MSTRFAAPLPPAATAAAGMGLKLKVAAGIAVLLVLIYIYAKYKEFSTSPVGNAINKILGAAGAVLTWLAGLPNWLLIGALSLMLLGPAIYKLATSSQAKSLAENLNKIKDKLKDLMKDGKLTEAEGELLAKSMTATEVLNALGENASGQKNTDAVESAAMSVRSEARAAEGKLDPDSQRRVDDARTEIEDELRPEEGAHGE